VEVNTIAVAFAGMSENIAKLHADALRRFHPDVECIAHGVQALLDNKPCQHFAEAISQAHQLYKESRSCSGKAEVCFLVFDEDHLELDQILLETALLDRGVRSVRATLSSEGFSLCETETGNELWLGDVEISLVYFHTGYEPGQYTTDQHWEVRKLIEMSCAVKVPTVSMQLAGCKRVQEVLTHPSELRRFLRDEGEIHRVCEVFATQVDPSSAHPTATQAVASAREMPSEWVLKPQREGGGNNLYGEELREVLAKSTAAELSEFVLMRKIASPPIRSAVMCPAGCEVHPVVGELGLFSALVMKGGVPVLNATSGFLMRTKNAGVNEGGICAGVGILDMPLLI